MDRGAWRATVHGVAKSRIQLSRHTQHTSVEPVHVTDGVQEAKASPSWLTHHTSVQLLVKFVTD